jgi:hypothetical protein
MLREQSNLKVWWKAYHDVASIYVKSQGGKYKRRGAKKQIRGCKEDPFGAVRFQLTSQQAQDLDSIKEGGARAGTTTSSRRHPKENRSTASRGWLGDYTR